ncbi:hypothetical protein IMCC1989_929 [gamma proteobacterium IMCC1989]|nr:hypothetical protein IMCC1989_929 [gamma proteobacterium IMCC1989]
MSAMAVYVDGEVATVSDVAVRSAVVETCNEHNNKSLYPLDTEKNDSLEYCQKTVLAMLADAKANSILPKQRLSILIQWRDFLPLLEKTRYLDTEKLRFSQIIDTLIELAYLLCDWSLLIFIRTQLLAGNACQSSQKSVESACSLSTVYQHIGRYDLAEKSLVRAVLANPNDLVLHQQWCALKEENAQQKVCYHDSEISLTPLTHAHLHDFAWQYNELVKELCNLPLFVKNEDWHYWYQDMQADPNRHLFAVIHQEWGFIGCVNLQVFNGTGFFYYWLGDDFQGCGFGPRAVSLLMDFGYHEHDMHCCYAKVYAHNLPSHKAIDKLGFQKLPFTATHPDENEVFYYCGDIKPDHQLFAELTTLLQNMDSAIQPIPHKEMFTMANHTNLFAETVA